MRELTSQDIIDGLTKSGGVLLWSIDEGCDHVTMTRAITAWRKRMSEGVRRDVAHALIDAGLAHQTVRGVTGIAPRDVRCAVPMGPSLSRADGQADAAFMARWGHV
jgi:hypothetical protein